MATQFAMDVQQEQTGKEITGQRQAAAPPTFQAQVISSAAELSSLAAELEKLDVFATCPMQSYRWTQACSQSFTEDTPCILLLRCEGEVVAYAALAQPAGEKRLLSLGHQLFEPTVFAYADQSAGAALSSAILELSRPIFLRDVYVSFSIGEAVKTACLGKRICIERPMPAHPWLELDQSWLEPEQQLNSGRRSDLRRARKQAVKQGAISYLIERLTPANVDAHMEEVFEVESRNWKGRAGSAMSKTPAIQQFYRTYARMAAEQGIARVLMMRIGETTVAVQFGVEFNHRFWLLKMGYDETFSRCSPGILLMVESLRYATECGLKIYEMMGVQESWNQIWTESAHEAFSLRIYAPGVRGLMAAGSEMVRIGLRKAAQKQRREK